MTEPLPDREPIPLTPPAEPIAGDSHAHLIAPLQRLAGELGYRVDFRALPDDGPGGWCDPKGKEIVAAGPVNRRVRTLVLHETAHALGIGHEQYGRDKAEVLVDCVVSGAIAMNRARGLAQRR